MRSAVAIASDIVIASSIGMAPDRTGAPRDKFLEVARTNAAGRALYASAGYRQAGIRRGYYTIPGGARIDALVLSKPLTRG